MYLWDYKLPEDLTRSSGEFVNTIQNCCFKRYLGVGTEKGQVLVYHMPSGELKYRLIGEPWITTLENCSGLIWLSGQSKSLMCIRIKDNKIIFVTNRDTKMNQYDGSGIQIYKEKAHRYFIYNSKYSNLRLMNSQMKKEILRVNMFNKV